jgi:high affinity Mn2+ porin
MAGLILAAGPAYAADDNSFLPDWLAIHGQTTFTLQGTPDFPSPYVGPNSLKPGQRKETFDATAFIGVSPWHGGELWINPEVDQGFGLSDTLGVAGFPSGEAYKVGEASPYLRLQRLFFRQTIDLGGNDEAVDGAANQFGGRHTANRLVLTVGKFGVVDVFDTNRYAHDPRGDFLNWSIIDTGSFDYAADAWGYSYGAAAEWYQGPWTFRLGGFNLSKIPNGEALESDFSQYQLDAEVERRYSIGGRDGALRITFFRNRGRFGSYADALALARTLHTIPDTNAVLRPHTRMGVSLNVEQAITDTLGVFLRAGLAGGNIAPYDFTDIDRTAAAGVAIDGKDWGRAGDTIGVAEVVNGISAEHRRYLAAGGLGVLVGDGRLPHAGPEAITEVYYSWVPIKPVAITFDYQFVVNPAYNSDRGPANILALRLHGSF